MPPEQTLSFGAYRLAGPHGPLWCGAQVVPLPPKALAVLWRLASQAGQVVTKEALLEAGWAGTVVSEAALTTSLRSLRQALGEDAQQPRYVATVHRLGYRFVAPVTAGAPVTPPGTPPSPPAPPPLVVGRAAELAHLHAWFAQARQGQFLADLGLAAWPDGTVSGRYGFRHALYQEVLYQRLGSARRVRCHRAIGARLEAGYGAQASQVAAALAVHFERGRDYSRAVRYLGQAAEQALGRWAYQEASIHLRRSATLLQTLPDTPERARQELAVQLTLAQVLDVTLGQGAADVEEAYTRARALCQQLGDTPQLWRVLAGLRRVYLVRGELQKAHELGKDLLRLCQRAADPAVLLEAHYALGITGFWRGEVVPARAHLEQSLSLCTAQHARFQSFVGGTDEGIVTLLGYTAWSLWVLGYPAQALQRSQAALTLARESPLAYALVFALSYAARVHWFRRETRLARERTEAALTLARQQGFPLFEAGEVILQGWALVEQGSGAAGLVQMHQGLAAWQATRAETRRPYWLALLAAAYSKAGQATEGFGALAEALTLVAHTGERWWEAELYRLQGELHLQAGTRHKAPAEAPAKAEACFHRALGIARRQQAKSLELRAAMSLSRLWQQQGKRKEAHELLAPIHGWFTEGFDTKDLQEAKALLAELS